MTGNRKEGPMTARTTLRSVVIVVVVVALWRLVTDLRTRRWLARAADRASRRLRFWSGQLQGCSYRLRGRRPDPGVGNTVLADRIRSSLGPLEKRLDVPRLHIDVEDHIAFLHGDVPSHDDAARIERALADISGVVGVESYLHVGPIPDDQRARTADVRQPATSEAKKRLIESAFQAGAPVDVAAPVVRAVLAFLAERVPADELDQFANHLPHDVRSMCTAPSRTGARSKTVRSVPQLVASLAPTTAPLSPEAAEHVVEAVFGTLRDLVPEEDHDIAAVLPEELREFWLASMPH